MEIPSIDMKHKPYLKEEAFRLRKSGSSIRFIAKALSISSSTASIWCKNIELSPEQRQKLDFKYSNHNLLRKWSQKRHTDKLERIRLLTDQTRHEIQKLNKQELFITGIALYWAEGFKNIQEGRIGFCNSDPRMIIFIMQWFRKTLNIPDEDFTLRAEFNSSHQYRQKMIESYWSKITGIPVSQFNKPYLQKTNKLREYKNQTDYHGVLRIRIRKSSILLIKVRGWIEGLSASI